MNFLKISQPYIVFLTSLSLPMLFCHSNSALEKVTFLGVSSSTLSENMSEQLNLPKGVHLVVDQVSSNSPAADSGLKLHDVLLQLDEQILVNSAQLKALVQMKDSGDIITLKILRKGKPKILKVTLSEIDRQLPRHGNHRSCFGAFRVGHPYASAARILRHRVCWREHRNCPLPARTGQAGRCGTAPQSDIWASARPGTRHRHG